MIDTDGSGTVDRIEWLTYVCAPVEPGQNSMGHKGAFDLELREYFEKADVQKEGVLRL